MENLQITESIKQKMLNAVKWQKFLNILMCIAIAILVIVAVACFFLPQGLTGAPSVPGYVLGIIYLLCTALYYYPLYKSIRFVSATREALNNDNQMSLEEAADCYESILKYCGILSIIALVIYALLIFVAIIGGIAAFMM